MFLTIKKGTLLTVDTVTYAMCFLTLIRVNVKYKVQTLKNRPQTGFFTVMPIEEPFLGPQRTVKNHFFCKCKELFFF